MNQVSTSLDSMNELLQYYTDKYGFYSIAALMIKYNLLICSMNLLVNSEEGNSNEFRTKVLTFKHLVEDHYANTSQTPFSPPLTKRSYQIDIDGTRAMLYHPSEYKQRYFEVGVQEQSKIIEINQMNASKFKSLEFYIYALTINHVPLVWTESIPIKHLVEGRRNLSMDAGIIAHPVLLHNEYLIARGAGEIVFVKNSQGDIKATLINNKSGHYHPHESTLSAVSEAISKRLSIPKENIITISISGV